MRVGGGDIQSEQAEGTKEFEKDDMWKCGMIDGWKERVHEPLRMRRIGKDVWRKIEIATKKFGQKKQLRMGTKR